MFTKGNFMMKTIYINGQKELLIKNTVKGRAYHTHVPYNSFKAAQMIVVRADDGNIPEDYPNWMVESINRIWFGKDYKDRTDICNDNLYTNDRDIRFPKKKKKKGNKRYINVRR